MKRLKIKYNSQRNNKRHPWASCNVTCLQMALSNDIEITDDELWEMANGEIGNNFIQDIAFTGRKMNADGIWLTKLAKKNQLNLSWYILKRLADTLIGAVGYAKWGVNWLTFDDIREEIELGYPVITVGSFTKAGHIVLIIGYDEGGFVCHDPWGDWNTRYKGKYGHDGRSVYYTYRDMKKLMRGKKDRYWAFKVHTNQRIKI